MANQMIALGARVPQVDILGGSIQRNAQLINMMMQQRVAERQAAKAQQDMVLAQQAAGLTAEEKRRAFRKADMEYLNNQLPSVKDDVSWNRWLGELKKVDPGFSDDLLRATGGRYNPDVVDIIGINAEQYLNKKVATPVASAQQDPEGNFYGVTVGGLGAPTATKVTVQPTNRTPVVPAQTAAPQPPALPSKFDQAFAEGIPAGEDAIDAAAQAIARGANISDPAIKNLTPKEFDEANLRAGRIMLEKPISFEQGGVEPLTMQNAPQIVQAALDSGFIDPSHVQQLKQMLPQENQAAVDQWVQQSGLKVQPGLPGMRSAVYRPQAQDFGAPVADDGMAFGGPRMPMAQQIVNEPGTQFRGKPPMQGPLPGSAQVPLPRVRAEAQAQRKTPQETYEETRSTKQAESDVKFLEGYGAARESAQTALGVINSMIGDARLNKAGQIEIPRGGRTPHPGFEDVIGATWRPGARFIPGTNAAGFDAYLEQVEGGAFLEAYERLKGTGQITEVEGQKATRAITRMKRSVSETEFVKAAREFEGIIRSALARADERAAKLKGAAPRRTPVKKSSSGWGAVEVVGD